jgi:hypothetical protein
LKYFSLEQIQDSMRLLIPHHPVFSTTFFVMKKEDAPIGSKKRFSLDSANRDFLEKNFRAHPKSDHFFRLMRGNADLKKDWVDKGYPGKGLQKMNTTGLPGVLLHDSNDNTWGWTSGYVKALAKKLPQGTKVPLFHLAVWFYRDFAWEQDTTKAQVVRKIIADYSITNDELTSLFDTSTETRLPMESIFRSVPVKWHQILDGYSLPDDVPQDEGGVLTYLESENIGPTESFRFEPSKRLNIVTGDNGLGKTFLLDLAWWALTQDWAADRPMIPFEDFRADKQPSIKFIISGEMQSKAVRATYSMQTLGWELPPKLPARSGLVIYGRVDGSFAIWDPANRVFSTPGNTKKWPGVKFSREEVWHGKTGQIEGLIRDWVRWQNNPGKNPVFETFKSVLTRVSPPGVEKLVVGDPIRLPGDIREVPTLKHSYGQVPVEFESAGIRRIIALAYLIVWAWEEHKIQAKQAGKKEERQMVVILDEAEAHLHPKWQRVILPALLGISKDLSPELSMQLIVATHSPLVLASSEPIFDVLTDKLYHLELSTAGKVSLNPVPFEARGSVDSWLTSPIFQIGFPGSPERELAIKKAIAIQTKKNPTKNEIEEITESLRQNLPTEDSFWLRWIFFAEKFGIKV